MILGLDDKSKYLFTAMGSTPLGSPLVKSSGPPLAPGRTSTQLLRASTTLNPYYPPNPSSTRASITMTSESPPNPKSSSLTRRSSTSRSTHMAWHRPITLKTHFFGEWIIFDRIFASSNSVRECCFADITYKVATLFLEFLGPMAKTKQLLERFSWILDLYVAIFDL